MLAAQKKEAARQAKIEKLKSQVFEYTPLAETSLGSTSCYNLYGVVIDAHMPQQKNEKKNFCQFIKIIDPSMHHKPKSDDFGKF